MNRILLAYCRDNAELAQNIDQQLSRIGIPFEHVSDQSGHPSGHLAHYLAKVAEPVLLLVTDNFLKSAACLDGLLGTLQGLTREGRVVPVVADGFRRTADGGTESVPTHFDRMVYALQYMNHWQSAWLDLSDSQHHAEGHAKEMLIEALNTTRNVANEMGDIISALREAGPVEYPEFAANDYAAFFQRFGLQHWHQQYKHIVEQTAGTTTPPPDNTEPIEAPTPETIAPETPSPKATETTQSQASSLTWHLLDADAEELDATEQETFVETPAPTPDWELGQADTQLETTPPAAPEAVEEASNIDEHAPNGQLIHASTDPAEIEQYISDARFWLDNGHSERGFELLQTALGQYPDNEHLQAVLLEAQAKYQREPDISPSPSLPPVEAVPSLMPQLMTSEARSYELMGDMALQKGDHLFAKYCWDRTLELAPNYPNIYQKLGTLVAEYLPEYRETGLHYLKQALIENQQDALAYMAMAKLSRQNQEWEAAEVYYRSAFGIDPDLKTEANDNDYLSAPPVVTPTNVETPPDLTYEVATPDPVELPTPEPEVEAEAVPDAEFSETGIGSMHINTPELPEEGFDLDFASNAVAIPLEHLPNIPDVGETAQLAALPFETVTPENTTEEPDTEALGGESSDLNGAAQPIPEPEPDLEAPAAPLPIAEPIPVAAKPAREPLTILITGATSGIGRAIAELFAQEGHRLILTGRRVERLAEMKHQFEAQGNTDTLMLPFDVRDYGAVRAALENLPEAWREVDILINNAGLAKGLSPIHEGDLDHWETMIDTNIKGLLYVARTIAPNMVRRRRGHIINVGSIAGKEIYPNGNVYCASKAAVDALTKAMRYDLYTYNIRVSQVSPGHVEETEFAVNRFDGDAERGAKVYDNFQPLRASDVAEVVYFMATRPPHVNIQDVVMYGTQQASATLIDRSGRS